VVPSCVSCEEHHINGFNAAIERVKEYLKPPRAVKPIPKDEQQFKDETMAHPEYQ
jgi:hypothetical protein